MKRTVFAVIPKQGLVDCMGMPITPGVPIGNVTLAMGPNKARGTKEMWQPLPCALLSGILVQRKDLTGKMGETQVWILLKNYWYGVVIASPL